MKRKFNVTIGVGLALVSLVLIGRATTTPIQSSRATGEDPTASPGEVRGQAGLVAEIDPETGELGLPKQGGQPELSAEELNALSSSDEGLVQVFHPDGSVSIDLQGRFQSMSMAKVGPDGRVRIACVDGPVPAAHMLDPNVPAVIHTHGEEK